MEFSHMSVISRTTLANRVSSSTAGIRGAIKGDRLGPYVQCEQSYSHSKRT
jgi:hypothetical protein